MRPIPILLLCSLLLSLSAMAQDDDKTPYNPKANYHTWSFKGKLLLWPLGNGGGISSMAGIEYGFAKNQSIGVDGFIEYQEDGDDNIDDTTGVHHETAQTYYGWEKAVFLNYRYYFDWPRLRKHHVIPYALLFFRYGKIDQHFNPLYPLNSFLDNYETQRSVGIMLGSTIVLKQYSDRLGLDINLGIFDKKKDISTVYYKNDVRSTVDQKPIGPGFRLSVNLVYWFYFHVRPKTNA